MTRNFIGSAIETVRILTSGRPGLEVDVFVDAGYCPLEPTTLLDLTGEEPVVLREGQGVVDF